jgi:hypothetical protein
MENVKWNYFQYRKPNGYQIFIRFRKDDLYPKFQHLMQEFGFMEMAEADSKKIELQKPHVRLLTIQGASSRLNLQINGSDLLDKYGLESLSFQAGIPLYTYRRVGIMSMPMGKPLWDLALNQEIAHTDQMVGLRIVLVRFLAQALSEQGVLVYWGTVKDGSVLVMKQQNSFGEAVLIDFNKRLIFSNGGEIKLGSSLRIIRKDKDVQHASLMNREELISFLSVSTCLLNYTGITHAMKRAIYDLTSMASGRYGLSEIPLNL